MASLVAKKKGHKLYYYYVVESARVEGKPRIVHQTYLGTAQKVADLVKDRTAPIPVSAASRDFGLPGALWLAAQQTGVLGVLEALWPAPCSPALRQPITCCWRPSIVSANRDPRPRWRTGIRNTILHSGLRGSLRSACFSSVLGMAFESILLRAMKQ